MISVGISDIERGPQSVTEATGFGDDEAVLFRPDFDHHRAAADFAIVVQGRGQFAATRSRDLKTLEATRAGQFDEFHRGSGSGSILFALQAQQEHFDRALRVHQVNASVLACIRSQQDEVDDLFR